MLKQIHEIKNFLLTARRKDARSVKIKRSKYVVKFKVRCSKYLYTLCVFDPEKADKLKRILVRGFIIEMDAKNIVDAINGDEAHNSVFRDIIIGCKRMLSLLPHVRVHWIYRDVNALAHRIAKIARDFSSPYYWVERPNIVDDLTYILCLC
ncbi:hypothetical protein ACS0TY_005371 [Phlomoides rotata]